MGKYGKRNKVKLDPFSYNIGFLGESGIGKTTLVYQMCEKYLPEDGYMFLECGKEDGDEAIEGINAEKVEDWDKFDDVITDIIENKTADYPNLKVVVVDTYDELINIAIPEVIRMHNVEYQDKQTTSIKACFGGFAGGEDKCDEIIMDRLWDLKTIGVHFIIIGHTKRKDKDDPVTGMTYSTITANMGDRHFNHIKTKLHFCGVCFIDREIIKEKTGKKNIVTKKEEERGKIVGESRKVIFRDDNYSIESKSRFADITSEKLDLNADHVFKAIDDAIKAESSKSGKSLDDIKKDQEEKELERLKQIKDEEKKRNEKKELKKVLLDIRKIAEQNNKSVDFANKFKNVVSNQGYDKFSSINDVNKAKIILKELELSE